MGVLAAIVILGILVTVHELGHFLVAKWCGVGVLEFSVGFGPVLFAKTVGETTYSLRAIPLGGFVRMAGDDPQLVLEGKALAPADAGGASPIEGTQSLTPAQEAVLHDESKWFLKKPYLPRCAVVIAGPLFNFVFAWILAAGMYAVVGLPHVEDGPVTVGAVAKGLPADEAGILAGDKVISVNGQEVPNFKTFVEMVRGSEGKELQIVVDRPQVAEGQKPSEASTFDRKTVSLQPAAGVAEMDVLEGREAQKTYRIGVTPAIEKVTYEKVSLVTAVTRGGEQIIGLSLQTLRVLKALVTGLISPTKTIGGPIEIIKQTAASADEGIMAVISMMIFLNVSLGVFNLLPIPVLDGGHLTLFTLERIKGSPLSLRFQRAVTSLGMGVLLLLMVFAIGNDLVRHLL
jgi:regulator of sigma E protease